MPIPEEVLDYVRSVFLDANRAATNAMSNQPGIPEPSLDQVLISKLQEFAAPHRMRCGWLVRIETHFLGGMRHFGSWEIADIGLLVFLKSSEGITRKVALLQSKRLYPLSGGVSELRPIDFRIGFARVADPELETGSIGGIERRYKFSSASRYAEIKRGSEQMKAIDRHTAKTGIPTFYCLYNPWRLPFAKTVPISRHRRRKGAPPAGVRICPSPQVHAVVSAPGSAKSPAPADLTAAQASSWSLEEFVADQVLTCRQGARFAALNDARIENLFYRRTGPIAAALSVWIEEPSPSARERGRVTE